MAHSFGLVVTRFIKVFSPSEQTAEQPIDLKLKNKNNENGSDSMLIAFIVDVVWFSEIELHRKSVSLSLNDLL